MRVSPSNVSIKARRRFSFGSGPKSKSDCGVNNPRLKAEASKSLY